MKRILPIILALLTFLLNSCAQTYLVHPFPEQKLNDTNTINFHTKANDEYGGWIVIARAGRLKRYFSPVDVYYNGRFIGQAGHNSKRLHGLKLFLEPGIYTVQGNEPEDTLLTFKLPFEEKKEDTIAGLKIVCTIPMGIPGFFYHTSKAKNVCLNKIDTGNK